MMEKTNGLQVTVMDAEVSTKTLSTSFWKKQKSALDWIEKLL